MRTLQAVLLSSLAMTLIFAGCDDDEPSKIGNSCVDDSACGAAICLVNTCVDPEGDADSDGLVNRLEVSLQTNPSLADSDNDGKNDADELVDGAHVDSDNDGKPDALESATADADGDCKPDENDADDATDLPTLVASLCGAEGVCAGASSTALSCNGTEATCDFSTIADYDATDGCDALDNDCDGLVDEDSDGNCYPTNCQEVWFEAQDTIGGGGTADLNDGPVTIDPDGNGGFGPAAIECLHSGPGGGWTRMSAPYWNNAMQSAGYRYLFVQSGSWVRTGTLTTRWDWQQPGSWANTKPWLRGDVGSYDRLFDCAGDGQGDVSDLAVQGAACRAETSYFIPSDAAVDTDAGTVTLCAGDPADYDLATDCNADTAVYVEHIYCLAATGEEFADGSFDSYSQGNECYYLGQPGGLDLFSVADEGPGPQDAPSITIAASPDYEPWNVGIWSGMMTLLDDHVYKLSFDGRAASPFQTELVVGSWRENTDFAYNNIVLPTTWAHYELGFQPKASGTHHELQLLVGGGSQSWFDNLKIEDMGLASCQRDDANWIANGNFAQSSNCWFVLQHQRMPAAQGIWRSDNAQAFEVDFELGSDTDETGYVLAQGDIPLQPGTSYRLSFTASSPDGERSGAVQLFVQDYARDLGYGSWSTELPFSMYFDTPTDLAQTVVLEVKMGQNPAGRVRISNVELIETTNLPR